MRKLFFIFVAAAAMMWSCDGVSYDGETDNTDIVAETDSVIDEFAEEADTAVMEGIDAVDTLVQCAAITKKGTQCERLVNPSDTYCFQHKNKN